MTILGVFRRFQKIPWAGIETRRRRKGVLMRGHHAVARKAGAIQPSASTVRARRGWSECLGLSQDGDGIAVLRATAATTSSISAGAGMNSPVSFAAVRNCG
jgi:hypothetical protein